MDAAKPTATETAAHDANLRLALIRMCRPGGMLEPDAMRLADRATALAERPIDANGVALLASFERELGAALASIGLNATCDCAVVLMATRAAFGPLMMCAAVSEFAEVQR